MKRALILFIIFFGCSEKKEEVKYGIYKFPYCPSVNSVLYSDSLLIINYTPDTFPCTSEVPTFVFKLKEIVDTVTIDTNYTMWWTDKEWRRLNGDTIPNK